MEKLIWLLLVGVLVFVFFKIRKGNSVIIKKKTQLKKLHQGEAFFLCDSADDLGDNLIQFYGELFGTSLRPGMKISILDSSKYTIKEIYGNSKTPNKPDGEIPDGTTNIAIVIEADNFNWQSFKQNLKREKIVVLKLV